MSLIEYMNLIQDAMNLMLVSLNNEPQDVQLENVHIKEEQIDQEFEALHKSYLRSMEKKKLKLQSGLYYHDLINELERLGDHIESVSKALAAPSSKVNS